MDLYNSPVLRSFPEKSFIPVFSGGQISLLEMATQTPNSPAGGYQLVVRTPTGDFQSLDGTRLFPDQVHISPSWTSTVIKQAVESTLPQVESSAPWGMYREMIFDPGLFSVGTMALPTGQSLSAPAQGSSVLKYSKHSTVVGETAMFAVPDDLRQKRGIHGRGTIRNIVIDGAYDDALHAFQVHGFWYSQPVDSGDVHYFEHVVISKCTGSGWKVQGRDQFCGIRTKANDNKRYGFELIDMNDSKLFAPGSNGNILGALYLEHCATPKFYGCDFGNPNSGFLGTWTVTLVNQARAMFDGGEIQGRIGILGRNDNATNQWEMTNIEFIGINFKIDGHLSQSYVYNSATISAQIYLEDVDGVTFTACKLQYDDNQPVDAPGKGDFPLANTPDYFIYVAGSTAANVGAVRFCNMHNLAHRRSRPGDPLPPMVCFKKNVCNIPQMIEWDFAPGELVLMKYNGGVSPRNYVLAGAFGGGVPATYNKSDYPFGFLWVTGLNLDNVATTFDVPIEPYAPPAGYRFFMRVWP